MDKDKLEFINNEILTLTILGGLGRGYPVYKKGVQDKNRDKLKNFLREELPNYSKKYKNKIDGNKHIKNIEKFADDISSKFSEILKGKRLKIGRAQKLLNLYLKYLWVLGWISVAPPHCPFDSVVISKLNLNIRWTKSNKKDYIKLAEKAKKVASSKNLSIAEWELQIWNQDNLKIN